MIIKAIETLRIAEFPNLLWVIVEDADGFIKINAVRLNQPISADWPTSM